MIGRRFSHYRIVEHVGAGGMGEVYRARDEHLPRDVAIKILPAGTLADEQARKRFRKEAETLSQLNHPHIATIYDFDTQDGVDFLVMEYVEGTTVGEKLKAGALPVDEVLRIGGEICAALEEAHERGIVHRDLKPGNIGLTPKGQVKVLDFGIAKVLRPSTGTATTETLTEAARLAGTLPYMSPEQLRKGIVDHRSDLYSLGVVLYEMSTGRRPFDQELSSALIADILHAAPTSPRQHKPQLSKALEYVILAALEKDPSRRYQSAHELLQDLDRARTSSMTIERAKRVLAHRWRFALAGSAVVLGAILIGLNVGDLRDKLLHRSSSPSFDSVVALPSEVFAGEQDKFLTDAIPRTLSTYLAQIEGLDAMMPPTSMEVEKIGGDLGKIAKAYGVAGFVVTTVTTRSERLTLNLQLVEAHSRRLVWTREYEGERQAVLDLVREAADGLRQVLRPQAAAVAATFASSEVEEMFQRGVYHSNRYNNEYNAGDFESAMAAFQQVLSADSTHADAASGIALLYTFKYESGANEAGSEVERWARRALQADPRNAGAWATMTYWERYVHGDLDASFVAGFRAGTLGPRDSRCQYMLGVPFGNSCLRLGLLCDSMASRLDPLYAYPPLDLARQLALFGRAEEGLALIDRVRELEPSLAWVLYEQATALVLLGRDRDASRVIEELEATAPRAFDREAIASARALLLAQTADADEWRPAVERALDWNLGELGQLKELLVTVLARRGEVETVLDIMSQKSPRSPAPPYDWLMLCADLDAVRRHPRFEPIAAASRQEFDRMLQHVIAARGRSEFPVYLEGPLEEVLADLGMPPSK